MKSCVLKAAVVLVAGLVVGACSKSSSPGGGGGDDFGGSIQGTFVDSPVVGLGYSVGSNSGFTNNDGRFTCTLGETITFRLGNLVLGSAECSPVIFPMTLTGEGSIDEDGPAVAMAVLLQALNDGSASNRIVIPAAARTRTDYPAIDFSLVGFDPATIADEIEEALTQAEVDTSGFNFVTAREAARAHLEDSLTNPDFVTLPPGLANYDGKYFLLTGDINPGLSDDFCSEPRVMARSLSPAFEEGEGDGDDRDGLLIGISSQTITVSGQERTTYLASLYDPSEIGGEGDLRPAATSFITSDRITLSFFVDMGLPLPPGDGGGDSDGGFGVLGSGQAPLGESFSIRISFLGRLAQVNGQIGIEGRATEEINIIGEKFKCIYDLSGGEFQMEEAL